MLSQNDESSWKTMRSKKGCKLYRIIYFHANHCLSNDVQILRHCITSNGLKKSAHNWPRFKLSPKCLTKPDCPWYQFSAAVKEVFRNSEHLGLYSQYPRYEGTSPRQRAGAHLRQRPFCQISEALVTQTLVPIGLQWAVSSFRHTWTWCLKATTSGECG